MTLGARVRPIHAALIAGIAGSLACLALPAGATAGTVSIGPRHQTRLYDVNYIAAPGETNGLSIRIKEGQVTFRDTAGARATPGCDQTGATVVRCSFPDDKVLDVVRVGVGDGNDSVVIASSDQHSTAIDGGDGNDRLVGGEDDDVLAGGLGDDVVSGGVGFDRLVQGAGSDGADVLIGGPYDDTVDYSARATPVVADLAGDADDGFPGERDTVSRDVDRIVGGSATDHLTGGPQADRLNGGAGADLLDGMGGSDALAAGRGRDADRLVGSSGDDQLSGNDGPNVLDGGRGFDTIVGRGGEDVVPARDGHADDLSCGGGRDDALVDGLDFVRVDCERRRGRRASAATMFNPFGWDEDTANGEVAVGCPADGPQRCRGTVYAFSGRRRLSHDRFSIPRSRSGVAFIAPSEREWRTLGRRGGDRIRLVLVTRDRRGRRAVRRLRATFTVP